MIVAMKINVKYKFTPSKCPLNVNSKFFLYLEQFPLSQLRLLLDASSQQPVCSCQPSANMLPGRTNNTIQFHQVLISNNQKMNK